jgi:hypothetical protein
VALFSSIPQELMLVIDYGPTNHSVTLVMDGRQGNAEIVDGPRHEAGSRPGPRDSFYGPDSNTKKRKILIPTKKMHFHVGIVIDTLLILLYHIVRWGLLHASKAVEEAGYFCLASKTFFSSRERERFDPSKRHHNIIAFIFLTIRA